MPTVSRSDLDISSRELDIALDEYLDACLAQSFYATSLEGAQIHHANLNPIYELIKNEHLRASLFQKQIQQAQAAISFSRNSSSATVLINALPAEVLTRIFGIVTGAKFCQLHTWCPGYEKLRKYPILLTHVCAHWRQIMIGTPSFWTHIDVHPRLHENEWLWHRTQAFISRAGCSPLSIHISFHYPTDEH
ncbi:hypothetical protein B0J17DRAFT_80008 [Rhizoctonia solani]|nr:hypothetical protein B0J17DRAFT_80008 [Rhizoctonia solani]